MSVMSPKKLGDYLQEHLNESRSILDLGCGERSPLRNIDSQAHKVGVDIFEPAIEASRKRGIHDDYVPGQLPGVLRRFDSSTFDATVAIDVLEHLTDEEGDALLGEMERIAKKKTIVFTPNGYVEQGPYDGNPHQAHKSGWTAGRLRDAGFTVVGVNGWKPLRGRRAQFVKPTSITSRLSPISQYIVKHIPSCAFALFGYKSV